MFSIVVIIGHHSHNDSNKEKPSSKDTLGICVWNSNSLKHKKLDRIKSENFKIIQEIFSNNDITCFTETWREKNDRDLFDWVDDFIEYHKLGARNNKRGQSSGGISVLVRKSKYCLNLLTCFHVEILCKIDLSE